MARIRTVKPEFFTSLTIAALPLEARLTFIGLWTHVDDEGRCVDDPRLIKAALWPLDDRTASDVELDLKTLSESSLIARYTVSGHSFLAVTGWREHQRINRPTASKLPPPPDPPTGGGEPRPSSGNTCTCGASRSTHAQLSEDSHQERKGKEQGKEGKGSASQPGAPVSAFGSDDAPPSPRCDRHQDDPNPPPCGQCADARRAREQWDRDRAARAGAHRAEAAAKVAAERRAQAAANRAAIDACHLCDNSGYRGRRLCDHDPDGPQRAQQRAAEIRAQLAAKDVA